MFEGIQQGLKKRSVLITGHYFRERRVHSGVFVAGEPRLCVVEGRERSCQRNKAERGRALWAWGLGRFFDSRSAGSHMTAKHLDSSHCMEDDDPILELSETREGLSKPALRFRDRFPRPRPGPTSPGTRTNDEETHPFDDSACPFDETTHPSMKLNEHPFDETTHLLDDSQT